MSLSYNDQYNIAAGCYFAFSNKKCNKRTLSVSHSKQKRDKMKNILHYSKYENWSKENFIVAVLYINFEKKPSSLISLLNELNDLDDKDAMKFKNEIIYYKKFLNDDITNISIEEGNNISYEYMVNKYRKKQIKWYTFYFYLVVSNNIERVQKSRIDSNLLLSIKKLLLYITFSQDSMMQIKKIMQDGIKI